MNVSLRSTILITLAVSASVALALAQTTAPPAGGSRTTSRLRFFESADGQLGLRAEIDPSARTVEIDSYGIGSSSISKRERFVTRYTPTSLGPAGDVRLCVGGVSPRTGNTILEIWTFDPPRPGPEVDRDGKLVPEELRSRFDMVPAKLRSIDELYDARTAGMEGGMVIHAMPSSQGGVPRVLVRFVDGGRVYEFDLASKTHRLVASPTPEGDALVVPLLARPLWSSARRHRDHGQVYVFSVDHPKEGEVCVVVLIDRDRAR
jgi:hypothetical protein